MQNDRALTRAWRDQPQSKIDEKQRKRKAPSQRQEGV